MTAPDQYASVRYLVDDVQAADRLLHHPPRLHAEHQRRARLRRRGPRPAAAAAVRARQLRRPRHPRRRRHRRAATASTSSSTTWTPRSPGSATRACPSAATWSPAPAGARSCSPTPPATWSNCSSPPSAPAHPHRPHPDRWPRADPPPEPRPPNSEIPRYHEAGRWIHAVVRDPRRLIVTGAAGSTTVETPVVRGLPVLGNALEMAKDPAQFFVGCYRKYGPVFRIKAARQRPTRCIAGVEAANFMGTARGQGACAPRSSGRASSTSTAPRARSPARTARATRSCASIMRRGYSRERSRAARRAGRDHRRRHRTRLAGRHDGAGRPRHAVHGRRPARHHPHRRTRRCEYVTDIRTTILYILNVLVTRAAAEDPAASGRGTGRPRRASSSSASKMIADYQREPAPRKPAERNLVDDIMDAHERDPDADAGDDLILALTGPYVAGLDTVANTTRAVRLRRAQAPRGLARVQEEVDALFASGADQRGRPCASCRRSTAPSWRRMRLYPIAVAQMRTATRDFEFAGHQIREGEMLYIGTSVPHFMDEFFPDPETSTSTATRSRAPSTCSPVRTRPTGAGPHTCLGKSLADVQMAISMARLFHRLDLAWTRRTTCSPPRRRRRPARDGLQGPGQRLPALAGVREEP